MEREREPLAEREKLVLRLGAIAGIILNAVGITIKEAGSAEQIAAIFSQLLGVAGLIGTSLIDRRKVDAADNRLRFLLIDPPRSLQEEGIY